MSTLMLCGSPHNEGGNSTYFLNALKEKLSGNGEIYNIMQSLEIAQTAFLQAVKSGENIVFSFPLYADAPPAYFLAFLKKLKACTEKISSKSKFM